MLICKTTPRSSRPRLLRWCGRSSCRNPNTAAFKRTCWPRPLSSPQGPSSPGTARSSAASAACWSPPAGGRTASSLTAKVTPTPAMRRMCGTSANWIWPASRGITWTSRPMSGEHFSFPQERELKSTYRLKMAAPCAARPPPPSAAMAQA